MRKRLRGLTLLSNPRSGFYFFMMRLVQIKKGNVRRVAVVEEPRLRLLTESSIHGLALAAIFADIPLAAAAQQRATQDLLEYDPIYNGTSEWRLLPAMDHPDEPACCLVSGTGLTHLGSARERQAMRTSATTILTEDLTDSMKMFRWGLEGGRPAPGQIGTPPEWFYKGPGTILRAHGEPLDLPPYAEDGGEEGEIAGVYLIGPDGQPRRLGMSVGNEFSDHQFEKKNYLNLAGSKLRTCAIGPELVIDPEFEAVPGDVTIQRVGSVLWSRKIRTGEAEMCHSLRNIEHHHFKFEAHRRPGDVHVHFFGADCLSFGDGIQLADGDVMQVEFEGFGRRLRNPMRRTGSNPVPINVIPLG
jgi:hypothetical protein